MRSGFVSRSAEGGASAKNGAKGTSTGALSNCAIKDADECSFADPEFFEVDGDVVVLSGGDGMGNS